MPDGAAPGMLAGMPHSAQPAFRVSEPGQDAAAGSLAPAGLFIVERRLPNISQQQLAVLQAALTSAASRFGARGEGVQYLGSIFLAGPGRLLSLFRAESAQTVRAVNEAALIPFTSIEPAVELSGPD